MAKMETMVLIGGHLPLIISVTGFVPVSAWLGVIDCTIQLPQVDLNTHSLNW